MTRKHHNDAHEDGGHAHAEHEREHEREHGHGHGHGHAGPGNGCDVDVAVVGGGAAGLSAATVLGRSRRSVVVIDSGSPRNAPAHGVHGFLSRDGISPLEFLAVGRTEVERYGVTLMRGTAVAAGRTGDGFEVTLDDGRSVTARRLLVTTGLTDELPEIPGLAEHWGHDVVHCPYCHGWEVRDRPIAVIGTNGRAVHHALLFRQLSRDVVLFQHTAPDLTDEQSAQLAAVGIRVVTGTVESVQATEGRITGLRLADGTVVARGVIAVAPRLVANASLLEGLGLRPVPHPPGAGHDAMLAERIEADPTGLTAVPGVWVAGNITDPMAQVVSVAAAGATAGAAINGDLVAEETRQAVRLFSQDFWDERYASSPRLWSGDPNPQLVATATGLAPGTALDAGCGEGADAIWLASRGWKVTGVDVSQVALDRAARHAARHAAETGRDVTATWRQADLTSWDPAPEQYDLVSTQFVHLPRPALEALHRRLAAAVRHGGTLLIVGHHPSDLDTTIGRPRLPHLMFTAEEVAGFLDLDPAEWDVHTSAAPRPAKDPEGRTVTIHDAVLRAVRR